MRFAVLLTLSLCACNKSSADQGLPPATDWQTDDVTAGMGAVPNRPKGAPSADPHGGNDPHAGMAEGDDEEESAVAANPHEGVEGAPPLGGGAKDVPAHGDPGPVDPTQRIKGTLSLSPKLAGRIKAGGTIFLMAKAPDADGKPSGTAMAVDRLSWKASGQAFELGGATGEVIVIARYDQDGDGSTVQAGDVVGVARVKVPADGVVIELDSVMP